MPLASLPGPYGCGDLGPEAARFARRLLEAGQTFWQVLPPLVTSAAGGDSPYSGQSSFALDPMLLSPERLVREAWVDASWPVVTVSGERVEGGAARVERWRLVELAAERAGPRRVREIGEELTAGAAWTGDFALYRALKAAHGESAWVHWPRELRDREPEALAAARTALESRVELELFAQALLARQWRDLREELAEVGLELWGDLPFYVAHDSADVWARRELFDLDDAGRPRAVSGCPPDDLAPDGQRWGQPVFDWEAMGKDGYRYWLGRVERQLELFDRVRIDHFRGLAATWHVPADDETASGGAWVPSPGDELVDALAARWPERPFVAEDLGVITDDVRDLLATLGAPGTRVVPFAFTDDPVADEHWPDRCPENALLATGTHDTAPLAAWLEEIGDEGREAVVERLGVGEPGADLGWEIVRRVLGSGARFVLLPIQDVLGLGAEARINVPGVPHGQWRWRLSGDEGLEDAFARLGEATRAAGRGSAGRRQTWE